jgi:hypothetical protein
MLRKDFVSNSSSSSFMLIGANFSTEEIRDAWLKLHPEDSEKFNEDSEKYDEYYVNNSVAYDLGFELNVECERGLDKYCDDYVFGLPYSHMKSDETKAQFEERIRSILNKVFVVHEIGECVDCGYEG